AAANLHLAILQDHEQDLAASAGAFRVQAEHWAEPSGGRRTAEAVLDLGIASAFALLGAFAAYGEIAGGGAAGLKKLIYATKEAGRKAAGKVAAKVRELPAKAVAARDKVLSQLEGEEIGLADTGTGVRMSAKIPDRGMTSVQSKAINSTGTGATRLPARLN